MRLGTTRHPGRLYLSFGALAVLLLIVAATFFIRGSFLREPVADTALAMPPDSYGYVGFSLEADPQLLYASAKASVRLSGKADPRWLTDLLAGARRRGVDPEVDVLPWLGRNMGVNLADVRAERNGNTIRPADPHLFLALSFKDEDAARRGLIKVLRARAVDLGAPQIEQTPYKGEQIYSVPGNLSAAVTDRLALVGANAQLVRDGIDRLRGDLPNLAESEEYRRVMSNLPGRRTAWFFSDTGRWAQLLGADPAVTVLRTAGLPIQSVVGATLAPVRGGNRLDFYSHSVGSATNPLSAGVSKIDVRLAPAAPSDSYLFFSGENLSRWWRTNEGGLREVSSGEITAGDILDSWNELGLDLGRDVFGHFTGEYGVAMLPVAPGAGRAERFAMLLEADDPDSARQSIAKVQTVLTRPIVRRDVGGEEAYLVERTKPGQLEPGYLLGDGYAALALNAPVLERLGGTTPKLAGAPKFVEAMSQLEYGRDAVLFVDVPAMLDALYRDQPADRARLDDTPLGAYLSGLRMAMMGVDSAEGENRGSVLLFTQQRLFQ